MIPTTERDAITPLQGLAPQAKELISNFLSSPMGESLNRSLQEVVLSGINAKDIERDIAGKYFENLAYFYLLKNHGLGNNILLSPDQVKLLYCQLYPQSHVYSLYNFRSELIGVSIPDGLLIRIGKKFLQLTGACEYTLCHKPQAITRKREQFCHFTPNGISSALGIHDIQSTDGLPHYSPTLGEKLHQINPQIPALPVCLGDTWNTYYVMPEPKEEDTFAFGKTISLPVNRAEFRSFIDQTVDTLL